jgi:hypothetical protein
VFEKVKSQKSKNPAAALLCHSTFALGKHGHVGRSFGLLLGGMAKNADTQFMLIYVDHLQFISYIVVLYLQYLCARYCVGKSACCLMEVQKWKEVKDIHVDICLYCICPTC